MDDLIARIRAAVRDFFNPPLPSWLFSWYWLDRWDEWRERRAR